MAQLPCSFQTFLDQISRRGIHRGLDRMQEALRLLGHPQKNYRIIHIAGTNGKGSTCTAIAQILAANGYCVGLALSPHVDDYRERIQISDETSHLIKLIPVEDLLGVHGHLQRTLPEFLELTYFEWSTLLALEYFKQRNVEFAVLETGMGGRWDATNTCDSIVSGVTTIGYDHTEYLGDTLNKILNEKLQIVKPGSDFLFGPQDPALVEQAQKHCQMVGAQFFAAIGPISHIRPISYLQKNWAFAVQAVGLLQQRGVNILPQTLLYGPHVTHPPARLEIVSQQPEILVDGAHNEEGLTELKRFVDQKYSSVYDLVFGCLSDRPFERLASIVHSSHNNYWVRFDAGERTTQEKIYESVQKELGGCVVSLDNAFYRVILDTKRPMIVCGSLYLCAQFKEWFICRQSSVVSRSVMNVLRPENTDDGMRKTDDES